MDIFFNTLINFIFIAWSYIILFHGRFFLSKESFFWSNKIILEKKFPLNSFNKNKKFKKTSVIVPARNEEKNIAKCIEGLINQKDYIEEIIIIDDDSYDKTRKVAKQAFLKYKFQNFKIIPSKSLPIDWNGKTWALNQGKDIALKNKKTEYLLFVDADIFLENDVICIVQNVLKEKKLDMISLMAKLNCTSFWEKLLIPSFIFFFQKLYPFNQVNKNNSKISAAAGGFIFCNKKIFLNENLFEKIRDKIIDDCNLAKAIKQKGSIWLGLTNKVKSIRIYESLQQIWLMVSRTAYEQLNCSLKNLFISILGMIFLYQLAPFYIFSNQLIFNQQLNLTLYLIYLLPTIIFLPTIKFYNLSFIYVFLLPISSFLYILMTMNSAYNFYFKKGNVWKNRKYK